MNPPLKDALREIHLSTGAIKKKSTQRTATQKRITNFDETFAQPLGKAGEMSALLSKRAKNSRALPKNNFIRGLLIDTTYKQVQRAL